MANFLLKSLRDNSLSTTAWLVLVCSAIAAVAWYAAFEVVLQTALFGFSPVGMMHPTELFPDFGANFPNGEGEMMKSLVGRAYLLFGALALPDRYSAMAMIAAEAAILIAGATWLARRTNPHLPFWTALAAAVLVSSGTIASADFARWFHPYYGSVYNFAFGLGFAALAATLDKRLVLGGVLIGLCAAVHPIIALFIGIAMGFAVLAAIRSYPAGTILSGVLAAAAVFGLWYLVAYRGAAIAAGSVDPAFFTTLTRLMSSHWHPIGLGIFGARAWEVLLPFCALGIAYTAAIMCGPDRPAVTDRQVATAVIGLFLISLVGLWLSETTTIPVLIKLALHRSSLVLLLLAAIISVPRMMALAVAGPWVPAIIAGGLLLLPFWRGHGLPVAGAVLFAGMVAGGLAGPIERNGRSLLILSLIAVACVCGALVVEGNAGAIVIDVRATLASIGTPGFVVAFAVMIAARLLKTPALAAGAVFIGVAIWVQQINPMRDPETRAKAEMFLEVQEWARANTAPASVFMLDPAHAYGWRQYSRRPSFGTLREWLYSGWIYDTDPEIMAEGLRRAGLLGITLSDFKPAPGQTASDAYTVMVAKAQSAFSEMDATHLSRFASDNGIAYFVFERFDRSQFSGFNVVFENIRYAVVKPI